jgi:hypothetical protein
MLPPWCGTCPPAARAERPSDAGAVRGGAYPAPAIPFVEWRAVSGGARGGSGPTPGGRGGRPFEVGAGKVDTLSLSRVRVRAYV